MNTSSEHSSQLIIGAGAFGASTALYLKSSRPSATVTLLDRTPFPNPSAASHDVNKIVRADYDDLFYMKIGLQSMEKWRNDPTYKPYYHEVGMVYAEDMGIGRRNIANYESLGGEIPSKLITVQEAKSNWNGIFGDGNWTGVKESYWSMRSGWGEADQALRNVIQTAVDKGVVYNGTGVQKLIISSNGTCTGVITQDGRQLSADQIVLCTGARTAQLLATSAPKNKDIQVNGRMVAAGAVSCTARLPPLRIKQFEGAPVLFNGMEHTRGESIPPTKNGVLKFNSELSFTNVVYHEESKQNISIPPSPLSQSTWGQDVPQALKDAVKRVMTHTYGKEVEGIEVESYRMCWDAVTPNQDFIISPHPKCSNLYIAAGGSFHGWKFLPVLGSYVVQMLEGKLDAEAAKRWAWDRVNEGGACPVYLPAWDLKDIPGYSDIAKD